MKKQPSNSAFKNFTRGGQVTLHHLWMFAQISNKVFLLNLISIFLFFCLLGFLKTASYERYAWWQMQSISLIASLNNQAKINFKEPDGTELILPLTVIRGNLTLQRLEKHVTKILWESFWISTAFSLFLSVFIVIWLKRRGRDQASDEHLKGDRLVAEEETARLIKTNVVVSDLRLGQIYLPKGIECAHFLFHGTTGTGKSTAIKKLLDQIRLRGDRAIIYDKSCNFFEEFYDPKKDILLNPLDLRGRHWDLWLECRDQADFDTLAAAQIPMPVSSQDPFWINAARTIFSAAAFEMRHDPDRSVFKLLRYLLTVDLVQAQNYLKGTEAETLVSERSEKTAISIRSVLTTYLKSLKYLYEQPEDPFSIRQWIQNESQSQWLFITSLGDRHETLKPLISSWLDIAVNALLSLAPNSNRRIWLILDELSSLQQLPYLTQTLSEARKFGGCVVIGLQSYAQLEKIYGQAGAREISSLLNTRLMFRQPDPLMAHWSADNLGESVFEEARESISYGANTLRDGVSIHHQENRKAVLSYSELMRLDDLRAYARIPGDWPITTVYFPYQTRRKLNPGFLPRKLDENLLKEVGVLCDVPEKPLHSKTGFNPELQMMD